MSWSDRLAGVVTNWSRVVIVVLLAATLFLGAGSVHVEESTSFESVEGQSVTMQKNDYVEQNFEGSDDRTTRIMIVTQNESGNALSKPSLLRTLELHRSIRDDESINRTLVADKPIEGVANVVARAAVLEEHRAEMLPENASRLETDARQLQNRSDQLNRTVDRLRRSLLSARSLQRQIDQSDDDARNSRLEERIAERRANATQVLNGSRSRAFNESFERVRSIQRDFDQLNASYADGDVTDGEYEERSERHQSRLRSAIRNGSRGVLSSEFESLRRRAEVLEQRQQRLENATASLRSSPPDPTVDEQIEQLESMTAEEVETLVSDLFRPDSTNTLGTVGLKLLPKGYEPGTATTDARMLVVTQRTAVDTTTGASLSDRTIDAQLAVKDLTESSGAEHAVFGQALMTTEESRSMADSFAIIGPLALVFVLLTLALAYRDLLDIALGMLGVGLVLVWTFGAMGWMGMEFNQIMIAVPVLLIGLSIDYSVHVVMRFREERADGRDVKSAMRHAVGTVGVALALVTATTAVGFMTNLTSSLPDIRKFGIVSAIGIVSALFVFGALVPALKVQIDGLLERFGVDRTKPAIGTGEGRLNSVLSIGVTGARKAPVVVLVLVLLLSVGSAYAGAQVESSFSEERYLADDPPEWTNSLPDLMAPGEYSIKEDLHYIDSNFQSPDNQVSILVEGNVTDPRTLERLAEAEDEANDSSVTYVEPGGDPAVTSPLSTIRRFARQNESVNEALRAADTDGDGIPDRNVSTIYDALHGAAPEQTSRVVHRADDGEYESVRMVVSVRGTATPSEVASEADAVATTAEHDGVTVTSTGGPVVDKELMEQITSTVAKSLALTIGLVFVLLMVAFRLTGSRASLGALTLVPTLLSVSWILGTMYLLEIPFSFTTAVIGSISIGLGVDYGIHVSERYSHELSVRDDYWEALRRTVNGTGGALLSSAVTTATGFGVLTFTLLPGLRQFGLIIALSLVYAFISSVFVLPALLVLWTRAVTEQTSIDHAAVEASTDD